MSKLKIVYYSHHPALHKVASPVTEFNEELKQLVQDMYAKMYEANGVGLAAPQVGIGKRIAVIDVSEERNQPFCIINPEFLIKEGKELMGAGCLSIPGTYDKVPRATYVKVRAQKEDGEFFEVEGTELLAHCLQHEIDHLDGKLYIDYLSPLKRRMWLKKMEKFLKNHEE